MKNMYRELKYRQEKEFNEFPIAYAYTDKQFEEGMQKLGLDPKDTDKICTTPGGGFCRKSDETKLEEMLSRFDKELAEAIEKDRTGEGFIYDMFLYELDNHEYCITNCLGDTLYDLGFTYDEVRNDERLWRGLKKAALEIRNREDYEDQEYL